MAKVHLDFGHGGKDPGALGNGLKEKDINLSVGLYVGAILEKHNVDVSYSRITDVFIGLTTRANIANRNNADIFASIHCNAFSDPKSIGLETLYYQSSVKGMELAQSLQSSLLESKLYNVDRGLKARDNVTVLIKTKMPSALVEMGFITNAKDALILRNKQTELAEAIARGILDYLNIKHIDNNKLNLIINGYSRKVEGYIKNGISYIKMDGRDIPARLIGESLGLKVGWDERTKSVIFND